MDFSSGDCYTPEKLEIMVMQSLEGGLGEGTRCIMVYVKEVNNKNKLWKIVRLTSFQKPQFQSILNL